MHSKYAVYTPNINRTNIVTGNTKFLKILPFYRLYLKAWPEIRKPWVNPKKIYSGGKQKAVPIRFTKVNVINEFDIRNKLNELHRAAAISVKHSFSKKLD